MPYCLISTTLRRAYRLEVAVLGFGRWTRLERHTSDTESVKRSQLVRNFKGMQDIFEVRAIMDQFDSGQCWLQVAPPGNAAAPDSRIRSISLGGPAGNLVWAVDAGNRLHIRKEVSVVYPEGTSWVQVRSSERKLQNLANSPRNIRE